MKKLTTIFILILSVSAVWAQTYFPIPLANGDMESTTPLTLAANNAVWNLDGGFQIWTQPSDLNIAALINTNATGLAPGEGVEASQALRLATTGTPDQGWKIQVRSPRIDFRPTGAGSYVISYDLKSDSVITNEKLGGRGLFWHTVALWDADGGYITDVAVGSIIAWDDQFKLHEGFVTLTDTLDIPAESGGKTVSMFSFAIQAGTHSFSYIFDNFSIQGPESFYDLTFEVYGIVDEDTSALEGATVLFDGLDYSTDASGMALVEDFVGGSYSWSVDAGGFEGVSGTKMVSQFETIAIYLEEEVLAANPEIISSIYPNPASETVKITSESSNLRKVELVTLTGSVLLSKTIDRSSVELNISTYPKGIYFLKMVNSNNETFTERLIIAD